MGIEKGNRKQYGFFQNRRLFFKTLGLLTSLSLLTALALGIFLNRVTVQSQQENIDNLKWKEN